MLNSFKTILFILPGFVVTGKKVNLLLHFGQQVFGTQHQVIRPSQNYYQV